MSEKSKYPPDYWKLEKENTFLHRELALNKTVNSLIRQMVELEKERLEMWLRDVPPEDVPLQITRKGECKLIQFVPGKEN